MVSWDIEIGGVSVDSLQSVDLRQRKGGTLGRARCQAANTQANRSVDYSQEAVVYRDGDEQFRGPVTKKPSLGTQNGRIEFTIHDKRFELSLIEAHRPFYQEDPGNIIRRSVQEQATIKSPVRVHEGSSAADWSATTPESGLVGAADQRLHEYGNDVFAVGIPNGASGTFEAKYTAVPSNAIPGDGQVVSLTTRLMANNQADVFEGEVDLRDNAGNNYIWEFPTLDTNFREYEFKGQDAVTTSYLDEGNENSDDGTLVYRFKAKGQMPENRAIAIDHAEILPYTVKDRSSSVAVDGVENVGATINRRHDESVLEIVKKYSTEYGFSSWVDEDEVLHFEPAGGTGAPVNISQSSTPVVEANFDRDSTDIKNKVTVQGSDGVQVTAVDSSSVQFYGLSEREDQIVDEQIQTQREAKNRAEGFLEDEAWTDQAITFTVADSQFVDVNIGQAITIDWPAEDINAEVFTVSDVKQQEGGLVDVSVTGASN